MTDRFAFSPAEAADVLGQNPETIRRWLVAGKMPGRKVGGAWLIPIDGLRNWLNEGQEAHGRRRLDLSPQLGRSVGGNDQQRAEDRPANSHPLRPLKGRGAAGAGRDKGKRRATRCAVADDWRLPRKVGA